MTTSVQPFGYSTDAGKSPRRKQRVPDSLIRDTINGVPFYFKDYQQVLRKHKTPEEIMADSGLQALLKKYLYDLLLRQLDPDTYEVFAGEVGSHLDHKNNLGLDIAVFESAQLTADKFHFKYLDVVPKFVIEVDMRVSLDDTALDAFTEFLSLKTQKLFDFGVERLIWVLTPSKKVLIAMPGEDWLLVDWNKDIELWNGIKANIGTFLAQKGIQTP